MNRLGLVANPKISNAVKVSNKLIKYLSDKIELVITQELYEHLSKSSNKIDLEHAPLDEFDSKNLDLLIAVGGDGTILHALHKCTLKILGINTGVVGFLTEVQITDTKKSLDRILNNDYTLDKRVRLKTMLNDNILEPATNEVAIHTADIAKMRLYQIQVDRIQAMTIRADGIIVSTPTGSTSYAMSAGGPIMEPKVDAFIIVPIAPFKLSARPLVVPSSSTITIQQMEPDRNSILVIDGQEEYTVTHDDIMTITKSDSFAKFVRFDPNFYKSIEEKLTT